MKVLVTGGTGFVGGHLCPLLQQRGHEVVITSRHTKRAKELYSFAKIYPWSPQRELIPAQALEGVDAVINLMGENISSGRWTARQKQKIQNSRVKGTQNLVRSIQEQGQVKTLLSTSAIGFYPVNQDQVLTEEHRKGSGFLSDVCYQWEQAAQEAPAGIRTVILRVGVVLGKEGGALAKLLPIFKLGLGGPIGSGKACMSWIHVDDLAQAYVYALEHPEVQGVFNAVAPNVITNKEFTKALAQAVHKCALFPVPPLALKLAYGEMSTIMLDGQTVSSQKLQQKGFKFLYSNIQQALDAITS